MKLIDENCAKDHSEPLLVNLAELNELKAQLDQNWQFSNNDKATRHQNYKAIVRKFKFKGFAKALECAIRAGEISETQGHHPDIRLGWGYCHITFSTHSEGGLTKRDFICAAKLDLAMKA